MSFLTLHLLVLLVIASTCQSKQGCENVYLTVDKEKIKTGDSIGLNCTGCTTLTLEIEEFDESEFAEELANETVMTSLLMKQWLNNVGQVLIRCRSSQTENYKEVLIPVVENTEKRRGVHNPRRRHIMKAKRISSIP